MSPTISNKVVLVTGANQGLGFAVVRIAALREPSAIYILACRNIDAGEEAATKLRGENANANLEVLKLDITSDEDIVAAAKTVADKFGRLDVLINNAGIRATTAQYSASQTNQLTSKDLADMRSIYTQELNTNLTSAALITAAFTPLLRSSSVRHPKVINVTSGLASMATQLRTKTFRSPSYGSSKTGLNGLSVALQAGENDRVQKEGFGNGKLRYFVVQPGGLKTAFTNFSDRGKDPEQGAEVIVRLCADDADEIMHGEGVAVAKYKYEGGTYWEFEKGEMREVPW